MVLCARAAQALSVCEWGWEIELERVDREIREFEEELELLREYAAFCVLQLDALPVEDVWPEAEW